MTDKCGSAAISPTPLDEQSDRECGLYEKFFVERTDGRSAPGQKHDGCEYYVLDLDHDKHAAVALEAYASSCEAEYPALAADLRAKALTIREEHDLSIQSESGLSGVDCQPGPEPTDREEVKLILQRACDRDWTDETLYQTAIIAANAIYWRDREIKALKTGTPISFCDSSKQSANTSIYAKCESLARKKSVFVPAEDADDNEYCRGYAQGREDAAEEIRMHAPADSRKVMK